ncbi:MAG: DNA primase [Ruminococcus sp.]|nr:DNA primase [Ruminococcus sp.]MCM1380942.1 DNA primase [Muribaculaceae bacterium]
MAFPDQFILELKQNNPIDSLFSSYVSLKRQGRNSVCLCPFHSEKSPSCVVYGDSNSFYCFGCGAGGDAITFVMKIENLEYAEAVKFLADRAGMTMPDDAGNAENSRLKARILEINRAAARFFHDTLARSPKGEKGRRYFAERQLSQKTITKYGLGYAANDWHELESFLRSKGYAEEELVTANLCDRGRNGGLYDRFRDRVMFPIIDLRGNVIAFGGRVIDGEGPKYLNSADTPVFKKSRNLFSLNFAKKSEEKRLILAEGYMDVIAVNQAGFENVVATLGTALTQEQARLMSRYAEEIVIAYDSDGAGQNATHKAINLLSEVGVRTKIIRMEGAKDPDEYIKKFGALRFKQLLDKSGGAIEFELDKCKIGLDVSAEQGRAEYLKKCVNVLADISSPIEREVYIGRLADENKVRKETLIQQVNGVIKKRASSGKKQEWNEIRTFQTRFKANPDSYRHPKKFKAERGIIAYIAENPEEAEEIAAKLPPEKFATEFNRKVYEKMLEKIKNSGFSDILSLQSEFTADEMGKITEIEVNSKDVNINRTAVEDFINILLSEEDNSKKAAELSNDEFLKYMESLKSRKD